VLVDFFVVAGAAILVAVASQIRIPLGFTPVPLTGQTLAVLLVGAGVGFSRGTAAVALYLLAGVLGAPVFAGGGSGLQHAMGATGGYLIGFLAAAALLGWLADQKVERQVGSAIAAMAMGNLLIYFFGAAGLMLVADASLPKALELGVLPFVPLDAVKVTLAGLLLPGAWILVGRLDASRRNQPMDRDDA